MEAMFSGLYVEKDVPKLFLSFSNSAIEHYLALDIKLMEENFFYKDSLTYSFGCLFYAMMLNQEKILVSAELSKARIKSIKPIKNWVSEFTEWDDKFVENDDNSEFTMSLQDAIRFNFQVYTPHSFQSEFSNENNCWILKFIEDEYQQTYWFTLIDKINVQWAVCLAQSFIEGLSIGIKFNEDDFKIMDFVKITN